MSVAAAPRTRNDLGRLGFLTIFLAVLLFASLAASAAADNSIGHGGGSGLELTGPGGLGLPAGVAVSAQQGGDIYVIDRAHAQRVDQFDPPKPASEQFVRGFGWGIVPGAATGTGDLTLGSTLITNVTTTLGTFATPLGTGKPISGPGIPPGTFIAGVTEGGLEITQPATVTQAGVALTSPAGPGNIPTNEVQSLAVKATSGQFTLTFASPSPGSTSETTAPLTVNAAESKPTAAELEGALAALPNIGSGNVSVSGGPADETGSHPYLIEFKGRYADTDVRRLIAENLSLAGGSTASEAALETPVEGGEVLETCTTVCSVGQNGSGPGQFDSSDAIAVDNDPSSGSYGDVYVLDERNFRIEKYDSEGRLLLMFGGQVNKTKVKEGAPAAEQDLCTKSELEAGEECGAGIPGTGPSHFYDPTSGPVDFWANGNNSIAVGPDGTVYVGDYGRIQEFSPQGEFNGELKLEDPEKQFVTALALDSSGDLFERSATYENGSSGFLQSQVPGVREYGPGPAHSYLRSFDTEDPGSEPAHIAVDSSGDLIVADNNGLPAVPVACPSNGVETCPEAIFRAFRPDGGLYAVFTSPEVRIRAPLGQPAGIAVGAAANGPLFASTSLNVISRDEAHVAEVLLPQAGPPIIEAEKTSDIRPSTVTLHAVVNPAEFDTRYAFQYITQKGCEENEQAGHECFQGAEETPNPATDLGSLWQKQPVQAAVSGLSPNTAYRWRVRADSARNGGETVFGPVETLQTLGDVSVRGFATQTVAPELVTLEFELNNNNSLQPGHYTVTLGSDSKEGTLPAGAGSFEAKEATFTGLTPDTEYHYQLVLENGYGHEQTAEATVTTEETLEELDVKEGCSNVIRREENGSLPLPDCRAYEQVSPVFKAGAAAGGPQLPAAGERIGFSSTAILGGGVDDSLFNPYVAHRTEAGWVTEAPFMPHPETGIIPKFQAYDAGLDRWLVSFRKKPTYAESAGVIGPHSYYVGSPGGYLRASPLLNNVSGITARFESEQLLATSATFSHLFLGSQFRYLPEDPIPDTPEGEGPSRIYEASGGPAPSLRLVASVPPGLTGFEGEAYCRLNARIDHGQVPNLASAQGTTLFYTAPIELQEHARCDINAEVEGSHPNPLGLYACQVAAGPCVPGLPGYHPADLLSSPPAGQCQESSPCHSSQSSDVIFDGASPDGRLAWFTTRQALVDSDLDKTRDVYLAKLSESGQLEQLVQVSAGEAASGHPTPGSGAEVQGVLGLSPDGTHVAFVARGVLAAGQNSAGEEAASGADNLYVYDAGSGETKFVARLGEADSLLWELSSTTVQAQFTPEGRYLLFTSFAPLTADDTDAQSSVFRYDFSTGQLIRVSVGRRGNDANGNDRLGASIETGVHSGFGDEEGELSRNAGNSTRAISADGSRVVFTTAAPLVSADTNGVKDVYEWEEQGHGTCREPGGCISLISDGVDPHGADLPVISASGRDIAFQDSRGLVPADTDGIQDVYDAREGGGFPFVPSRGVPCQEGSPEACRGEATHQAPPINPVTESAESGGNGAGEVKCAKGKHKVKKHGQVRCVPNKHQKHHRKHQKRAARNNPGGGK